MKARTGLATLLLLLASRPSQACESGTCVERLVPADGDEVPFNAQMWVFYDNVDDWNLEARLYDANGQEVPTTAQTVALGSRELLEPSLLLLTPQQELQPNAVYELQVLSENDMCDGRNTLATFSTTDTADDASPEFEGIAGVETAFIEEFSANSSCSQGLSRQRYTVRGTESEDAVAYHLYEDDVRVGVTPAGPRVEGSGILRPTNVVIYDVLTEEPEVLNRCFVMRPVDIAGNEHDNNDEHCTEQQSSSNDDSEADPGGDCSCSVTSTEGAPTVLGLLTVLALCRRRQTPRTRCHPLLSDSFEGQHNGDFSR